MIIFGAGIVGEALTKTWIRPTAFVDENPNKKTCAGYPVIPLDKLEEYYPNKNLSIVLSTADIKDSVNKLLAIGYKDVLPGYIFFENYQPSSWFERYAMATMANCQVAFRKQNLFIHSIDLIITERCTMKCKDCSNLMQYYEHPKDGNTEEILKSIDALFETVDEVNEVRVIGGEPFMNKDWLKIVKRLLDEPKLHYVVIYTNGTIVPKEIPQSDKILVFITDYGDLSKNIKPLVEYLQTNRIPYHVIKADGWTACADIQQHNRKPKDNQALFKSCCVHNLINLSDGKLYHCPFEANLVRLGKIKDDGIGLTDGETIKKYLDADVIPACDYCNGRPFGAEEIPAGIQRKP